MHREPEIESSTEARPESTKPAKKPYPCNLCSKSFMSRNSLVRHSRIHTRNVLKCPDCKKVVASYQTKAHDCCFVASQFTLPSSSLQYSGRFCPAIYDNFNEISFFMLLFPDFLRHPFATGPCSHPHWWEAFQVQWVRSAVHSAKQPVPPQNDPWEEKTQKQHPGNKVSPATCTNR